MKIAIFCGNNLLAFDAHSLEKRPLGGTETGVIRLSESLVKSGHEVSVFTASDSPASSGVKYFPLAAIEKMGSVDVFISVRDWIPLFYRIEAKKRFFWTGDSYDQFSNFGLGDLRVSQQIDGFLSVSKWQANEICTRSGFPKDKVFVLGNGIHLDYFKKQVPKIRKRLIYSSTPYRGLEHIPLLFRTLKTKHPELEAHIFSSYKIYEQQNADFDELRRSLSSVEGIHIHPNVTQEKLAEEFLKSSILFYPCQFEETSCITAMEAMAAGCVVLSTQLGALPETVGDCGVLVEGLPGQEAYTKSFLTEAHRLLTDDELFSKLSGRSIERAEQLDWIHIAQSFTKFLENS